ncbi:MAG TPA: dihydroorotate dehydrogenase electron transfer subunit [Actinobacteria bacterium]|nr:dihydroorotate dehydrogenase electron transfer subunit [Actinomycetota bacterium]
MIQARCQLVEKKQISEDTFIFIFEHAGIAGRSKPGQFVHINIGPGSVARRPFSVYETQRDTFSILFKVVGPGTRRLATYRASQYLDIIGPLGHGFILDSKSPILVGGGMGVGCLKLLEKHLKVNKVEPKVLLGFKDSECAIEWPGAKVASEDGSCGTKGLVTDLLKKEIDSKTDIIYACGPEPMMKEVAQIGKKKDITTYISMERYMACGVGACLSCVCETKYGIARVCKEGPVFNGKDIIWEQ